MISAVALARVHFIPLWVHGLSLLVGDERCTLALRFSYRLDPHSVVPFKGSFVSVFVLIFEYAFKPAF